MESGIIKVFVKAYQRRSGDDTNERTGKWSWTKLLSGYYEFYATTKNSALLLLVCIHILISPDKSTYFVFMSWQCLSLYTMNQSYPCQSLSSSRGFTISRPTAGGCLLVG